MKSYLSSSNRGFGANRQTSFVSYPQHDSTNLTKFAEGFGQFTTRSLMLHGNSTSYLNQLGSDAVLKAVGTDFTFEFWVKVLAYHPSINGAIISSRGATSGGWLVYLIGEGDALKRKISFNVFSDEMYSNTLLNLNKWYHIACTYRNGAGNTSVGKIYINGVLDSTDTLNNITAPNNGQTHVMGYDPLTSGSGLKAQYDEIRFWTVERTADEIRNNYLKAMTGTESNLFLNLRLEEGRGNPYNLVSNTQVSATNVVWLADSPRLDDSTAVALSVSQVSKETADFKTALEQNGSYITPNYLRAADALVNQVTALGTSFATLDYVTKLYVRNLIVNGGRISASTLLHIDTFVKTLRNKGVLSKMLDVGVYCGDNLAAALTKLVYPSDYSPWLLNYNFAENDYSQRTGIIGDGATKALSTGLPTTSVLTNNNVSTSFYHRGTSTGVLHGLHNGAEPRILLLAPWTDGNFYSDIYNDSNGAGRVFTSAGAAGSGFGHMLASRTSSSSHTIYRNGTQLNSNGGSGGTFSSLGGHPLPAYGTYQIASSAITGFATYPCAFYHWGHGLNGTESVDLYNAVQALQVALGRNV